LTFTRPFISNYGQIVPPITALLKQNGEDFTFGEGKEAPFFKITILFTSGNTRISRHFDQDTQAIIEQDAAEFAIAAVLS